MNAIPKSEGYEPQDPNPLMQRTMRIINRTAICKEKIFESLEDLLQVVHYARSMGCVIALTMGSWDLIHEGHGAYIEKAKEEARAKYPDVDHVILVVGVDADELVRQRKGPKRPVVGEKERSAMIGYLGAVDAVIFEHELAYLHKHLPHDVRIISSSTGDLEVDEETSKYCRYLINLPPQGETSTTARIRRLIMEGGQEVMDRFREGIHNLLKEMDDVFKI